jgi:hypothetical protein
MSLLPSSVPWKYPADIQIIYDGLRLPPGGFGFSQRISKSPYGALHVVTLQTWKMSPTQENALYEHYCDNRGDWGAFPVYDPDPSTGKLWTDVYLGTGDGAVTVYPLKGKSTDNVTITVAGVSNSNWTKQAGAAADSQDQITFNPAPTGIIKARFTGIRYFPNCTYTQRGLTRTLFFNLLYTSGVTIEENFQ